MPSDVVIRTSHIHKLPADSSKPIYEQEWVFIVSNKRQESNCTLYIIREKFPSKMKMYIFILNKIK